jgi:hypothetical protein
MIKEKLENPLVVEWTMQTKGKLVDAWDFISNTNRLNMATGADKVEYTQIPLPNGGTELHGKVKNKFSTTEYLEYPYEWVENRYTSMNRVYKNGIINSI